MPPNRCNNTIRRAQTAAVSRRAASYACPRLLQSSSYSATGRRRSSTKRFSSVARYPRKPHPSCQHLKASLLKWTETRADLPHSGQPHLPRPYGGGIAPNPPEQIREFVFTSEGGTHCILSFLGDVQTSSFPRRTTRHPASRNRSSNPGRSARIRLRLQLGISRRHPLPLPLSRKGRGENKAKFMPSPLGERAARMRRVRRRPSR